MPDMPHVLSGLIQRIYVKKACPACGSNDAKVISYKGFHSFSICNDCALGYRYPAEGEMQMKAFYQSDYVQAGLTTDLPSDAELNSLLSTGFKGSPKDFTHAINFFKALGHDAGSTVLDFGANWGYTSYQFAAVGYKPTAYEISKPRAEFGKRLGLSIFSDLDTIIDTFDIVFTSHVLEHVPDPRDALEQQMKRTKLGGHVIGITPNGSTSRYKSNPRDYNSHWGKVHPVLLTEEFVRKIAGSRAYYIGSTTRFPSHLDWDGESQKVAEMLGPHLFFAIRC